MLRVHQPPEHVRVQVEAGEIEKEHAVTELGKLGVENPPMLGEYCSCLLQVFPVIEDAIRERLGIFRDSLSVKFSGFVCKQTRIAGRGGNRQGWIRGVNVYGRNVHLKAGMRLLEIETAHAFHIPEERNQLELNAHPVAPLALAKNKFMILHADLSCRINRIDRDRKLFHRSGIAFAKRVVRADQVGANSRVLYMHGNDLSTFDRAGGCDWIIGVKRKCTVGSAQIGRTHTRKSLPFSRNRWKI